GGGVRPGRGAKGNRAGPFSRPGPRGAAAPGPWPCRSSGVGAGRAAIRSGSWGHLLGLARDDVAVMGELPDQRIDLAERERGGRLALQVATDEPVLRDAELQRGGTRVLDGDGPVFLDEGQDAEDPADPEFAIAAVNAVAERANLAPRPGGA